MKEQTRVLTSSPLRDDAAKLSDRVAFELGTRIVSAELAHGSRLPTEGELCSLFRVSRSVIRDAIRTLSARGLVDVRQGHGMLVAPPSDATFAEALIILLMRSGLTLGDVLDGRMAIETELAPLAAERATENDWAILRSDLERYAAAVESKDWVTAQSAHLDFHYSLLESIHIEALRTLLKPMQQIILLSSVPPAVGRANLSKVWTAVDVGVHHPILDALEQRDSDKVRAAMANHFAVARDNEVRSAYRHTLFRESEAAQHLLREMLTTTASPTGETATIRGPAQGL